MPEPNRVPLSVHVAEVEHARTYYRSDLGSRGKPDGARLAVHEIEPVLIARYTARLGEQGRPEPHVPDQLAARASIGTRRSRVGINPP